MTQSNTSHASWKYFAVSQGVMAVEVPQNEGISRGGKNGGRKGLGSAIRRRGANRGSINIKK